MVTRLSPNVVLALRTAVFSLSLLLPKAAHRRHSGPNGSGRHAVAPLEGRVAAPAHATPPPFWRLPPLAAVLCLGTPHVVSALPDGFQATPVIVGLDEPTATRFSPDGRVFVAEKRGIIKLFDGLEDETPVVFADLSEAVYDYHDHGLLGLALDPDFPATPYVYALYALEGSPGGRLVRLEAVGDTTLGTEQVLITGWCQAHPSHSIGHLEFGPDGALYVSAGEGASYAEVDYGQVDQVCTDPTREGGALRAQDLETSDDPPGLSGALLRVDPQSGGALPDNPLYGGTSADDDRIIAYGLRNPYRFAIRPGTGEIWIGDVGWYDWEEIDRVVDPTDAIVENFGWPCFEGRSRQAGFDSADLPICEALYAAGSTTAPYYTYAHSGDAAISGLVFYPGGEYPVDYAGALFFADYAGGWIQAMLPDASGAPDPGRIVPFAAGSLAVVDLTIGPDGDLFFTDIVQGEVWRVRYFGNNQPPITHIDADVTNGPSPLTVQFDGSGSWDPDSSQALRFAWDLDGDGQYDDAAEERPLYTYTRAGAYVVRLQATDGLGSSSTTSLTISVDDAPPVATILMPDSNMRWQVGDLIAFSGEATDPDIGRLASDALDWQVILHHCSATDPTDCHEHYNQRFSGVDVGGFTAEDYGYPVYLELRLTATEPPPGDWWDEAWARRRRLTLNASSLPELVTDFPVLVRLDTSRIDYSLSATDGADLRFLDADGETQLRYEIETWQEGGESRVWVRVPSIDPAEENGLFWMYYANPGAVDGQSSDGVWDSDQLAVYHLEAAGVTEDATGHNKAGTLENGAAISDGLLGGALLFDGADDLMTSGASLLSALSSFTVSGWVMPRQTGSRRALFGQHNTLEIGFISSSRAQIWTAGGGSVTVDWPFPLEQWHYVAASGDGHRVTLYLDGTAAGSSAVETTRYGSSSDPFNIGGGVFLSSGDTLDGAIDEVRVSSTARSAAWIAAEYRSITDTLVAFDTEEPLTPLSDTVSVRLDPLTATLVLESEPAGLELSANDLTGSAPITLTALAGGTVAVAAPSPQILDGREYVFAGWSDGGAQSHDLKLEDPTITRSATFLPADAVPVIQTFTSSPETIEAGGTATLQWTVSNALDVEITPGVGGGLSSIGEHSVTPEATTTYTLLASGPGGVATTITTITVTSPPRVPFEKGIVDGVTNAGWTNVQLSRAYDAMVVICSPDYDGTSVPLIVRVDDAEDDHFAVRLDRTDGSNAPVAEIPVSYMVVEEGVYTAAEDGVTMEAARFVSTVTDRKGSWNGEARTFANSYKTPVVLGQVMSYNDPDYSVFWSRGSSRSKAPSSSSLRLGKHIGRDPDTTRADETIGYLVIEAGAGFMDGSPYLAGVGDDKVRGLGDKPPYVYSLSGLASSSMAIVSQAGMDGDEGGWALLYGAQPVGPGGLSLSIDEDNATGTNRSHDTEQVSYLVFE